MIHFRSIDMHSKKSDILVIHCADPRFQQAYRNIIDSFGAYFDLLVAPGASKAVVNDKNFIQKIKLLHRLHHFETVYILDHIECGAFGKIKDEIMSHSSMLNKAVKTIKKALPKLKVVTHLLGEKGELTLENKG